MGSAQRRLAVLLALAVSAGGAAAAHAKPHGPGRDWNRPGLDRSRAVPQPLRDQPKADQWIVELDAPPLARYHGTIEGLEATAPEHGEKLDADGAAARAYRQELAERQQTVLAAIPGVEPDVSYRTAFAGFAAKLTDEQVAAVRGRSDVRRVVRETFREPTASAPQATASPAVRAIAGSEAELMGLPDGLWKQLGGPRQAGKGVIVGVIDTGITPEAPSFAARRLQPPASWDGACQGGERFPTSSCNAKLIGARYFVDGMPPELIPPESFLSPRDDLGHGTHVAASAVGNEGVDPVIGGNSLGVGELAGVAPAAHLAAYKACWPAGCSTVDLVAAIDRAVADGVDVLNLSLGGPIFPGDPRVGPDQIALLNADAAGVAGVVAAGNFGTHELALGAPAAAPWTTAIGATTSARTFRTTIEAVGAGGAALSLPAPGMGRALRDAPLIDSRSLPFEENPFENPQECLGLEPEQVEGRVVICNGNAPLFLIVPSLVKARAAGAIFPAGDGPDDVTATLPLPALFPRGADVRALQRLLTDGPVTVSFDDVAAAEQRPDRVTAFSSRGPSPVTPDLLRPDVAAPGGTVLSAWSPDTISAQRGDEPAERYAAISGTSMATPQAAGAAALLTQVHPTWTPAAIRSALVTTTRAATDLDGGRAPHVAAGAGRIDPTAAGTPGLVLEPSTDDYRRYADGVDPASIPGELEPLAPRELNLPSISIGDAQRPATLTRTVTSVAPVRGTWTASGEGWNDPVPVQQLSVSPRRFTIAPGQRQELRIQVARAVGAPAFADAAIVLRNEASGVRVRIPVTARNPGIAGLPGELTIADAPAAGTRELEAEVSARVIGVAHGLARPIVQLDRTPAPSTIPGSPWFEDVTPIDVEPGTALLSSEMTLRKPPDPPDQFYGSVIYRDTDGDGRFGADDQQAGDWISPGDVTRYAVRFPAPGRYFVIAYSDLAPVNLDQRIWHVRDEKPDDPDPAAGLVLGGDPFAAYPAARHAFQLRWSDAEGPEALRGLVAWYDGDKPDPKRLLATTIVDVKRGEER